MLRLTGYFSALAGAAFWVWGQPLAEALYGLSLIHICAGQGDVAGDSPDLGAVSNIGRILVGLSIFLDTAAADFLQVLDCLLYTS